MTHKIHSQSKECKPFPAGALLDLWQREREAASYLAWCRDLDEPDEDEAQALFNQICERRAEFERTHHLIVRGNAQHYRVDSTLSEFERARQAWLAAGGRSEHPARAPTRRSAKEDWANDTRPSDR